MTTNDIELTDAQLNPKAFTPPKEHFIYRIQYTKGEQVRFIGHLDVMRLFQRAIKRAKLPVAYSQGFNPHQLLSFASPLTLGATSQGEYGDFEMSEKIEPKLLIDTLNPQMPLGMEVIDAILLVGKQQAAMAATSAVSYICTLDENISYDLIEKNITSFLAQNEIRVVKKTKSKEEETDIRQDIFTMQCHKAANNLTELHLFLAAGSIRNLKPEPVIKSLYQFLGLEFSPYTIHVHKVELFRNENGKYLGLMEGLGVRKLSDLSGVGQ